MLTRQFSEFASLTQRVRSIFFLATPYRGSDLALLLTKILHMSGARPFIHDLHRNSLATQSINNEFPQYCQDLQLFSFYETLLTNYIVSKGLIINKDLTVLGYLNKRLVYINANHREICKYPSQTDPNYLIIRNALASTITSFRNHDTISKRDIGIE